MPINIYLFLESYNLHSHSTKSFSMLCWVKTITHSVVKCCEYKYLHNIGKWTFLILNYDQLDGFLIWSTTCIKAVMKWVGSGTLFIVLLSIALHCVLFSQMQQGQKAFWPHNSSISHSFLSFLSLSLLFLLFTLSNVIIQGFYLLLLPVPISHPTVWHPTEQ